MSGSKETSYSRLPAEEVSGEEPDRSPKRRVLSVIPSSRVWFVHGGLFLLWVVLFVLPLAAPYRKEQTAQTPSVFGSEPEAPAPADVIEYEDRSFTDGVPGEESSFMGEPNDKNEAAWARYRRLGFIDLEHHEVENLLNISANATVRYVGGVDVFHHLHCVYSMRHMLYWPESIPGMRGHVEHCVEILRQAIMCQGSLNIDTHTYDDATGELDIHTPTFKGTKKCRNIEKLTAWGEERRSKIYWNFPKKKGEGH